MANFFSKIDEAISRRQSAMGISPETKANAQAARKKNRGILIAALLIAVLIAYYTSATSGIETVGVIENEVGTFYVNVIDINKIGEGLVVKINGEDAEIVAISADRLTEDQIAQRFPEEQLRRSMGVTKYNYEVTLDCKDMEDGTFAVIVPSVKESAEKIKAEQAAAQNK
ncbi:MAG: hypothetical protein IJP23_05925 [Oscillospiraceae bacterium]|nr:hypothetical protein [Oscillospiraceae bacterium]